MANPNIRIKRTAVPGRKPTIEQLSVGELGLNFFDADLFVRRERSGIGTDIVSVGAGATVTNILYVTSDGKDTNAGKKLGDAKATIAGAVAISTTGTVIKVSAGTYVENNPIKLPPQVSIVGDSLREVTLQPQNSNEDLFHVAPGNYISEMSFSGTIDVGKAVIAFDPDTIRNSSQSPYIRNCTNFIENSIGMKIDGNHVLGDLKSMVTDSYTQFNKNGIGVSITNGGYAQLVSLFTICSDTAIYCGSGGGCDLTNSNSSFGNYGLIADGVSEEKISGIVTVAADANSSVFTVAGLGTDVPYDGQVIVFDSLYYEIDKLVVGSGGTGYTEEPIVTIDAPGTSWGVRATASANIENGSVTSINIISNGRGYDSSIPTVTVSSPNVGFNTATVTAVLKPKYYLIESATEPVNGISNITITENLPYAVGVGSTAPIYKQSRILASSHSFEYIGSGVTITTALPQTGGRPIQENEVISKNGGLVIYTSTDQAGNFRIGDGVLIDQAAGTISGNFYSKSLIANVTPIVLALGGN
jgi:hypothetical protein